MVEEDNEEETNGEEENDATVCCDPGFLCLALALEKYDGDDVAS